jgi:hypothetical protein
MIFLELNTAEQDTLLAALRLMQAFNEGRVRLVPGAKNLPEREELLAIEAIAEARMTKLSNEDIDELIDEINSA